MTHPNHEKIYEIIKEHGPISLAEMRQFLQGKYFFKHNEIAGYLSKLSKNGLIKNIAQGKKGKNPSPTKIWIAVGQ